MPYSERYRLGELVRVAREREGLTQADLAERLGIERTMVSQLELGRPKKPIEPTVVNRLATILNLSVLEMVIALGYDVRFDGIEDEEEVALLEAYRGSEPALKQASRAVLGLPGSWQSGTDLPSLRRLAATGRRDRQETQE